MNHAMNRSPSTERKTMRLLAGLCLAAVSLAAGAESIVTGGKTGTYFAIGNNLKDLVYPDLEVKDSKGSWANVEDMSQTKGVSLAIVQSDVYAAFVQLRDATDVPQATRSEYARLLANLRVVMPLYKEEIHFLVRKDDPMEFIHQIKDKAIWMDAEKSGTYLTALNIYSKLFQERPKSVEPFVNPTATGEDEGTRRRRSAIMALSDPAFYKTYPKVDVLVLVGGQPLKLLEQNMPGNLKLLRFDSAQSAAAKILQDYQKADIKKASYPLLNIAGNESASLAVNSYLITANFADPKRNDFVKDFSGQLCSKFAVLQEKGHSKWKDLTWQPGQSLPALAAGWKYSDRSSEQLANCQKTAAGGVSSSSGQLFAPSACRPQDRVTGLCK